MNAVSPDAVSGGAKQRLDAGLRKGAPWSDGGYGGSSHRVRNSETCRNMRENLEICMEYHLEPNGSTFSASFSGLAN